MKIKTGDIFKLGNHTLGCGSSTNAEFVAEVVGEQKIDMVLTDPPYGVAYVEGKKGLNGTSKAKEIENDHLQTDEEYELFTRAWLDAVTPHLASYNTVYIFNSDMMFCALRSGMAKAGLYYSQMLVWVKGSVVIGRKDYLPQHEVIAYGWFGRHKMNRSKAKSILFHPKPSKARLHPTMKPVGLLRKIMPNNTKAGDTVYDPFGGSGSTLIAAEHMGRKCIMVEMDTDYVQTIISRWEKISGKKAEKLPGKA